MDLGSWRGLLIHGSRSFWSLPVNLSFWLVDSIGIVVLTCRYTLRSQSFGLLPVDSSFWRSTDIIPLCALNTFKLLPRPGGETKNYSSCSWSEFDCEGSWDVIFMLIWGGHHFAEQCSKHAFGLWGTLKEHLEGREKQNAREVTWVQFLLFLNHFLNNVWSLRNALVEMSKAPHKADLAFNVLNLVKLDLTQEWHELFYEFGITPQDVF